MIKDYLYLANGVYILDYRDKFNFGVSEIIPQSALAESVVEAIRQTYKADQDLFLVGYIINQDLL